MQFITILSFIIVSLIFGIGLVGLSLESPWINLRELVNFVYNHMVDDIYLRIIVFLAGLLIILIVIRFLQQLFIRSRREKTIKIDTGGGMVTITLNAVEDMIKKALEEDEIISHIRPRIYHSKKEITAKIRLTLKRETNIKDFAQQIQAKIIEKLRSILGKDKKLSIIVEIRKITSPRDKLPAEEKEQMDEEGPFRNY